MGRKVLVLNQDYRPVTVCNVQRAFGLLFLDKAELVTNANGLYYHTVSRSFPVPSIIRLNRFVNIPYRGVVLSRQNIFKRDGFRCQYCGAGDNLTLDHVVPKSRGGSSDWGNLITACKNCNSKKGDFTPQEVNMIFSRAPFKPSFIMFLRDFSGQVDNDWIPFLQTKQSVKV
jgi:5-methylcytosine-specific restriction endonuclease McrA